MSVTGTRWTRVMVMTLAGIVIVTLLFAWFAWKRRWISDDGLIFVRIVHQILDGNGPVYNAFERAEANTSALWPWLLALLGALTRAPIAFLAVGVGLLFSIAGVAIAMDGTRRWHRSRGSHGVLVPSAVLVPVAVFPFWDYASSGLETGLTTFWLAGTWWLFVTLNGTSSARRQLLTVIVFGLGPLVRPDLAIVSAVFSLAAWWILRPPRRRTVGLAAAGIALPLAYEIFRAGYYGTLVPLPALAKGATGSEWGRGWLYLIDFVRPSSLWIPCVVLAALLAITLAIKRGSIARRDHIVLAAPLVSAALMALYVLRVGGDFMHARMWLPATFVALMPGLLLPLRRLTVPAVAIVTLWAAETTWHGLNDARIHRTGFFVEDERVGYTWWTKDRHPIAEQTYVNALGPVAQLVRDAVAVRRRSLITEGGLVYPLADHVSGPLVFVAGRLGVGGSVTPVDGIVADTLGLANPIGARITITHPENSPGHLKSLPWAWLVADFIDPAAYEQQTLAPPAAIHAAARAMRCGELKELLDSVREPMKVSRFFSNLAGSIGRTRLVIPADPAHAEAKFCGASSVGRVTASSSCEQWGWAKANAIDGWRASNDMALGYSSEVWLKENHPEWIAIELPAARVVTSVVLHPRTDGDNDGYGFPIDFSIQIWTGTAWIDRVTKTNFPMPTQPQTFSLGDPVVTDKIRIHATKLANVPADGYVMQFAEIEAL